MKMPPKLRSDGVGITSSATGKENPKTDSDDDSDGSDDATPGQYVQQLLEFMKEQET